MDCKKINIGIFAVSDIHSGGGFQYEYMVLNILKKYHKDEAIEIKFYTINKNISNEYDDLNIDIKYIKENIFQKLHRKSIKSLGIYKILSKINYQTSKIEKELIDDKVDLIYFLSPSMLANEIVNIPYIFTLWDLGHLDNLEFPEISGNKEFERREFLYQNSLKKAFRVTVDS